MSDYQYELEMKVRDYECDIQGIVNNGVYQNYLEHARHEYMDTIGVNFKEYAEQGINFVVVRSELDYKFPLSSGDRFAVRLSITRESRLKIVFYQDIFRLSDEKLILKGKILATAVNEKGRPYVPQEVMDIIDGL